MPAWLRWCVAVLVVSATGLLIPAAGRASDVWPGWRGPTGLGTTDETDLPLTWDGKTLTNVVWKKPLPGTEADAKRDLNQSSPIVWKDRVFVMNAFWPPGVPQSEPAEHHVACYATVDGTLLWDVVVPPGPWLLKDLRGGYAAPTPCTDGKRLYVLFGSSELAALDFDGKLLWRKDVAPYAWDVAVGTSPVLAKDALYVLADGTKKSESRLIAFDPATGDIKWERKRPEAGFNHTTPVLVEVAGRPQLLIASSSALQGVDPTDGNVLWWVNHRGDVPTPVYADGLVYSENGRGGPGIAVDPTGSGDVSSTKVKWTTNPIPEGYSSPIIAGGCVFRAHNPGILKCFDLMTGERLFTERFPNDVSAISSPFATPDGRLYFASGGKSVVLKVGRTYEVLATNDLGDSGPASPAIAQGRIYLKGSRYLYCLGKTGMAP